MTTQTEFPGLQKQQHTPESTAPAHPASAKNRNHQFP